jgi:Trypsin-co-occurring domain 1
MAGQRIPIRVGDIELLVETVPVAGSEPTSGLDAARDKVVDAYERAQVAIVEVAASTADTIRKLAARTVRPDKLEVEFGLKFSAQGNVIVAGVSGEATLVVRLSYDTQSGKRPSAHAASQASSQPRALDQPSSDERSDDSARDQQLRE